jgi:hypothetical protein
VSVGGGKIACEEVQWTKLAQDRFIGVPVLLVMNVRIINQYGIFFICFAQFRCVCV